MSIYDHGNKNRWFKFGFMDDHFVVIDIKDGSEIQKVSYETFDKLREVAIYSGIKRIDFENGWWLTTMMMQNIEGIIREIYSFNANVDKNLSEQK